MNTLQTFPKLIPSNLTSQSSQEFIIKDESHYSNILTLVFYKHQDLKQIKELSGNLANSNEYQVHYFALVRTEKTDNVWVSFVFPLIYYNYKQQVSTATIDFDMADVTEKAKELGKLAALKANVMKELVKDIPTLFENSKVEYKLTFYNNIHRHP